MFQLTQLTGLISEIGTVLGKKTIKTKTYSNLIIHLREFRTFEILQFFDLPTKPKTIHLVVTLKNLN